MPDDFCPICIAFVGSSSFVPPNVGHAIEVASAVGEPYYFWDVGATLNVHFLDGEDEWKRAVIEIASEWVNYANLQFRFYLDPEHPPLDASGNRLSDIAISFWNHGGGQSYVGTTSREYAVKGQPSMWLPRVMDRRTILHEFGHAIGLQHEHQNPTAGIPWDKPVVYEYCKKNYGWDEEMVDRNIFAPLSMDKSQYSQFDPSSIMVYWVPNDWTVGDFEIPYNTDLSSADKTFIAQVYPISTGVQANEVVGQHGWDGWIAIDGEKIYLCQEGNLFRGTIESGNIVTEMIGKGGWDGSIAAENNIVYMVKNGNLLRAPIEDNTTASIIGRGGWNGSLAVDQGYVYLVKEGNLYRGKLDQSPIVLEQIGRGGWTGLIAVKNGLIYLATHCNLYRGQVNTTNVVTQIIGRGGWNGAIAVNDHYIYLAHTTLRRAFLPAIVG